MGKQQTYSSEVLALASEALRVTRTYNCTLFAQPDPDSDWGFTPESFLGSADWMLTEEGIESSGIARPAFELAERIRDSMRLYDVDLSVISRRIMAEQKDRVAIIEIVEELVKTIPELDLVLDVEARFLGYDDFYPEEPGA
jgi:hypothetical protein